MWGLVSGVCIILTMIEGLSGLISGTNHEFTIGVFLIAAGLFAIAHEISEKG